MTKTLTTYEALKANETRRVRVKTYFSSESSRIGDGGGGCTIIWSELHEAGQAKPEVCRNGNRRWSPKSGQTLLGRLFGALCRRMLFDIRNPIELQVVSRFNQ